MNKYQITLLVGVAFLFSGISFAGGVPEWLLGEWSGSTMQKSKEKTEDYLANFSVKAEKIEMDYPSLKCKGEWKILREESGTIWFHENIIEGQKNCIGVDVAMTRIDRSHVTASWFKKGQYGLTTAVLIKK